MSEMFELNDKVLETIAGGMGNPIHVVLSTPHKVVVVGRNFTISGNSTISVSVNGLVVVILP